MSKQDVTATLGGEVHASAANLHQDQPPRLSVAINELEILPKREAQGEEAHTYWGELRSPAASLVITAVTNWVCKLLERPIEDAWDAPAGRPDWKPDDEDDELWARVVTQMFLGCGYGGPDVLADFTKSSPYRKFTQRYLYQRLQAKHADLESSANPLTPKDKLVWHENADPAYSLVIACQSQVTSALLARGFRVETDFSMAGVPAHQCPSLRVFAPEEGGAWYGIEQDDVMKKADRPAIGHSALAVATALAQKLPLASGSIYTFNPYLNRKSKSVWVPDELWDRVSQGKFAVFALEQAVMEETDRVQRQEQDAENEANIENAAIVAMKKKHPNWELTTTPVPEVKTQHIDSDPFSRDKPGRMMEVKLTMQPTGSHVNCILRRWKTSSGREQVQLVDTTSHPSPARSPKSKLPAPAPATSLPDGGGMYDGVALDEVSGGAKFVGLGVMPNRAGVREAALSARKARPVGLARLVIMSRVTGFNRPDYSDVLYVSRLILTWGSGPKQNYYPASFLLSLRNCPFYRSVVSYWVVYSPRRELAEVMWAEGARSKSLEDMVLRASLLRDKNNERRTPKNKIKFSLTPGESLWPIGIYEGTDEGLARIAWQGHLSPVGKGSVPTKLRNLFLAPMFAPPSKKGANVQGSENVAGLLKRARDEPLSHFVHPALYTGDDAGIDLPDMLRSGA